MVKFLDNPGKHWMVGRYAIAYKNLNKMRNETKLVIVIIKFYFDLLYMSYTVPTPLSFTRCCFGTTTITYSKAILKFSFFYLKF